MKQIDELLKQYKWTSWLGENSEPLHHEEPPTLAAIVNALVEEQSVLIHVSDHTGVALTMKPRLGLSVLRTEVHERMPDSKDALANWLATHLHAALQLAQSDRI